MFNFTLILPEIFVLTMCCVVMIADLFVEQRQQALTYALTQLTLIGAFILTLCIYCIPTTVDFSGLMIHDALGSVLKLAIYIAGFFVFLYSRNYFRQQSMGRGEPYLLGLFSILGMMVLVSAHHFITLYLGLELMSLPIYALIALQRDKEPALEAAIKYFILGALASALLLYGLSMIYGASGSLDITQVANIIGTGIGTGSAQHPLIFVFGLVFVVAGLAFKIGLVPFHMWLPDVYTGAPNAATLFIAVAPKIAVVGMSIRLLVECLPGLQIQWQELLIVISILSMVLGNFVAIVQTNIKRMFAYSTMAHGGYILLGFIAGTAAGYAAALFYTLAYAIMSLGAFGIITLLSKQGFDVETIEDLRGLNDRNPWLAFMMMLLLFSMAGVPPTIGFFAKLSLIEALVNSHFVWLACIAMLVAVIGVYYYLRVIKAMYFDKALDNKPFNLSWDAKIAISINGLAILYFGIFPGALITLCQNLF